MKNDIEEVAIKAVMPTANGCAVFLAANDKNFVIYVDKFVGDILQMAIEGVKKDRPLTHDLVGHILLGLGAEIDRVIINDAHEGTFFARLYLRMENELGKKVLELDARPSDSMVLAIQHSRPIYVTRKVLDSVEDMSEVLQHLLMQKEVMQAGAQSGGDDSDDDDDELDDFLSDFSDDDDDDDDDDGGKK